MCCAKLICALGMDLSSLTATDTLKPYKLLRVSWWSSRFVFVGGFTTCFAPVSCPFGKAHSLANDTPDCARSYVTSCVGSGGNWQDVDIVLRSEGAASTSNYGGDYLSDCRLVVRCYGHPILRHSFFSLWLIWLPSQTWPLCLVFEKNSIVIWVG